ncbi:MAG: hypothetical protein NT072_09455 [Deltaproteobacteria bacterium]|nr:hypothetical protein [Deltaproteobacteria bacterium]
MKSVKYCMILSACGSFEEAERIARLLVEERADLSRPQLRNS